MQRVPIRWNTGFASSRMNGRAMFSPNAREKFGWDSYEKKENRGRGIAFGRYKNYAAFVAIAIEVEVNPRNGRIRVVRAVAANDSGHIINPDGIETRLKAGSSSP